MVTMQYYTRHTCLDCRGAGCVYCRGEGSILLPKWIAYNEIEDEHHCRRCKVNVAAVGICHHPELPDYMWSFADEDVYKCPKCGAVD